MNIQIRQTLETIIKRNVASIQTSNDILKQIMEVRNYA